MPFLSLPTRQNAQNPGFPKFAIADGLMTQGKVHHADAEATFRTVLKPREEKPEFGSLKAEKRAPIPAAVG